MRPRNLRKMNIDLDQAAQAAGVHKSTVFRAIKRGELSASKLAEDGKKPQYFLEAADLDAWVLARTSRLGAQIAREVPPAKNAQDAPGSVQHAQDAPATSPPPLDLRLALEVAAKTLDQNQELLEQKQSMEAELAQAWERAARAERQALELQHTLTSYQRALAEQAESLAEQRARAQAAEQALEQAPEVSTMPAETESAQETSSPPGWGQRLRKWLLG